MADIRALMAQERQARRINHEFASYSKPGTLMCTACQLNIRSETLWDGHLKSANHRTNVKKLHQVPRATVKRKIEHVEEAETADDPDARKKLKPKTRTPSETVTASLQDNKEILDAPQKQKRHVHFAASEDGERSPWATPPAEPASETPTQENGTDVPVQTTPAQVDEDEWAAFEREVAPLAQPTYSAATITAAPVTAAQLEAEAESYRKRLRDTEAEDEKEEEGRRMEEEFDVMEEMEERVRKLKEKREALRLLGPMDVDTGQSEMEIQPDETSLPHRGKKDESDESEEDADDWYS